MRTHDDAHEPPEDGTRDGNDARDEDVAAVDATAPAGDERMVDEPDGDQGPGAGGPGGRTLRGSRPALPSVSPAQLT